IFMLFTLAVLFAVNILNFYDRTALGAVFEPIRREFSLTDAQLGGLTTWVTLVYAFAGGSLGRLADTSDRPRLLAAGIAVWASLTGLAALAGSYGLLVVSRLGVGVGEAVCAPASASWIGDLVPSLRRARVLAIFMLGVPVGTMLALGITGSVAQAYGWR